MGCFNIKHFLLAAIVFIFFISGCVWLSPTKELDLKSFTITVPKNWSYKHTDGIDSFVGGIIGPSVNLSFDFSDMGYANSLIGRGQGFESHNFRFDTTSKFIIKTVWPKLIGKGMTGIYIESKTSTLNFKISAYNLPKQQQDEALKAFKTIKIKGEIVNP